MCKQSKTERTHLVEEPEVTSNTEPTDELPLMNIQLVKPESSPAGLMVTVTVDSKPLQMELDTGASVSLVSEATWRRLFGDKSLLPSPVRLKTYTGQGIKVLGQQTLAVEYEGTQVDLPLIVVEGRGPSLFGRNWLEEVQLDWGSIKAVKSELDQLLLRYEEVFRDELGTLKGTEAHLELKPNTQPKFCKARSVPYSMKEPMTRELARLEKLGIIERANFSEWASPLVPVPKADGTMRMCGDYKITINPALEVDHYPMPTVEDMFATLAGGSVFSKIDLSQAYNQVCLDAESRKYATVNTHRGLYRYTRLPFGIAPAPAIFQQIMERILQGIPNVLVYIDDILVTSKNEAEHLATLEQVLKRLKEAGLRAKMAKCRFMRSSIDYLGYHIDKEGIHPLAGKVEAIVNAPEPRDVKELHSFLGLVNYYGKFIRQLSSLAQPLNRLLCKGVQWAWDPACQKAFKQLKDRLASSEVLVHYDTKLPLRLECDASAYGVGAVLSHKFPDGTERPIAYASRTLSSAERNYAQIEKEGLALIFGVIKFHKYVYGRPFTLVTDHKPLLAILGSKKGLPTLAAARMQRWAVLLLGYHYELEFRFTHHHGNADGFSRLPLPRTEEGLPQENATAWNLHQISTLPLTAGQLRVATSQDVVLSRVLRYTARGWPVKVPSELRPYHQHREELSLEAGCVLRGMRVVVPAKYRRDILHELHVSHPGKVRMKAVARSRVWWPGIDQDIERMVDDCQACQEWRRQPPPSPLCTWPWPSGPWERVHVDFAGPFKGSMFLVVVDAYSKWLEVVPMTTTSAGKTIEVLRELFSRYGLPQVLVSDNGPQFTASEFGQFMKVNGIAHRRGAPYHPATNGEAERFVQTFKLALNKSQNDGGTLSQRLSVFLLSYRTTPHTTS